MFSVIHTLHPALWLVAGALLCLLPLPPIFGSTGRRRRGVIATVAAGLALWGSFAVPEGAHGAVQLSPLLPSMQLLRVDGLSRIFALVFTLNGALVMLYGLCVAKRAEHVWALLYMAAALLVVFAGDLFTLYIGWELMAITSTCVLLARGTPEALAAAKRYIAVHIVGGLFLLMGILITWQVQGHISLNVPGGAGMAGVFTQVHAGSILILIGVLLNAGAPPLSAWLPDAYPKASALGSVILSAYTTKTAVYVLLRGFAGWEVLIWVGGAMALYGVIFALMENDIRRILAYSIINQVGFMVAAAGMGTQLAISGAAAHAFCHVLYKSLLFMSAGAVLHRVGTTKCNELGGLARYMPLTMLFGLVGGLAISSVPYTSGFTSKSLILEAAGQQHLFWLWVALMVASAGVFMDACLKFTYFTFFHKNRGHKPAEAPASMVLAMGVVAGLCIFLGLNPQPLYVLLPFGVEYNAYTAGHVLEQSQVLLFAALVFFISLRWHKHKDTTVLDSDWLYRRGTPVFQRVTAWCLNAAHVRTGAWVTGSVIPGIVTLLQRIPVVLLRTPESRAAFNNGQVPLVVAIALPLALLCIYLLV